jgi:predicted secreted protein
MRLTALVLAALPLALVALPIGCASSSEDDAAPTSSTGEDSDAVDELRSFSIDDDDSGKTFTVQEGQNVVLKLSSNATTGYKWVVVGTDRTFGYPAKEDYLAPKTSAVGAGGTQVFTWKTKSPLSMVGKHTVNLEYKRSFGSDPPAKKFSFTIEVTKPGGATCAAVRCASGTHCEMKGLNGGALPVCIKDAAQGACVKTGCSGQICADHDVITTCEMRRDYGCYRNAMCERQADGKCGFSLTKEQLACLTQQ